MLGPLRGYLWNHFGVTWGHPATHPRRSFILGYVRHIGTKTMRMNKLGQTVTAVVDTCVMMKNQSR